MGKSIINRKEKYIYFCLAIFLILLVVGCSKNTNNGNEQDEPSVTGDVINEAPENCRLNNESDCSPIEIRRGEQESEEDGNQETEDNIKKIINASEAYLLLNTSNASKDFLSLNCEEGWKCVEKKHRAYQYTNCSWSSIEFCVYGCNESVCRAAPICKSNSFKCSNDVLMKCEGDGYEWKVNESCDYRCENGVCIGKNETVQTNTTNSTNSSQGNNFISDNCISVLDFNYAPAGNNLSNEYFTLKNSCSYSVGIISWTAKDDTTINTHIFTFPVFNLDVNAELSIHTGNGTNTSTDLYFRKNSAVWNNDKDTLYMDTANGTSVLVCPYPNNGSILNCPDL